MNRPWRCALGALIIIHCCAAACLADLRDEIDVEIKRTQLGSATVAISVCDADSGKSLISLNAREMLIPASNMKLLTTGAALHILGPDFAFKTRLRRDGDRLIIVGDGDPSFGDPDLLALMEVDGKQGLDVESFLALWVQPVVASGLKHVSEIVVDDRIFDRRFVHPGWPIDQLNRRYCAEVAGFNFHLNLLHFYPQPGTGRRPDIRLFQPRAPWLELINEANTNTGTHDRNDAWIARKHNSNVLTLYGNVKFPYRAPVPVTVHDMPAFFARLFADRLREAGVEVDRFRVVESHEPKSPGKIIGPIISSPISTVVTRCNRESQNLYAEALMKRLAFAVTNEPGSWVDGLAVVRHVVHERLGNPNLAANVIISDGSGLSRENRIAAETMTAWLTTFHRDARMGPMFVASLPRASESGTLAKRFREVDLHGTSVRAKSGYVKHVSCLSGYITRPDGGRRCFSILVNNLLEAGSVSRAKKMQERIVSLIAWDMSAAPIELGRD